MMLIKATKKADPFNCQRAGESWGEITSFRVGASGLDPGSAQDEQCHSERGKMGTNDGAPRALEGSIRECI